ncbi:MAG: FapA family protein, partial [Lachnospiraceae bacterium]|nr:FapA family protein [Lachnospiraceae bacterium]
QEIRLGMEEGLDVSIYSKPELNWMQMEQIRMGLKDKVDVSAYADSAYGYNTMKQIRLSFYSSTDLTSYLDRGFESNELEQIRLALEEGLPIDKWLTDDMYSQQIHEIRIGLYEGLDVSKYADSKFNWMQMQEIRLGLEKKLKISFFANYLFNHWQMREIRLGLEEGLDVSSYAKLIYSSTDMQKMRAELLANAKTTNTAETDSLEASLNALRKKEFNISVEDNGNKAYAYIPWIPGNMVREEDIFNDLENRGITIGIKREAISDMIKQRRMNEKILIAEGTPAEKGKDGWFEFFVRLDLPRIPAPLPDGGVDYVNIEAFEMVDEGEKIAVYHPAEKGH